MFCHLAAIGATAFTSVKSPTDTVTNHTTHAPASDGSTMFLLGQCQSGCLPSPLVDVTLDLTGIDTAFTIALTDQTWSMAILACIPNITIKTREVRNDGHGRLSVQPLLAGIQLKRQGNLNPIQTTAMFSIATMSLTQNAGALSGTQVQNYQLGSQVQGDVLFGKAQFEGLPGTNAPAGTSATIAPAPIEDITKGYTQILQSASKGASHTVSRVFVGPSLSLSCHVLTHTLSFSCVRAYSLSRGVPRHCIRPRTYLGL